MLHPQDLKNFESIAGHTTRPEGFDDEYLLWLSAQHRMKFDGPLGLMMIPLCRQFGIAPPRETTLPGNQVNWRQVAKGQRVRVSLDTGEVAGGEFIQVGAHNAVEVKLDGSQWHKEFAPHRVTLDNAAPSDLSPSVKAVMEEEARRSQQFQLNPPAVHSDADESFPRFDQSIHGPPARPTRPRMTDAKWYDVAEGATVYVTDGDKVVEAKFQRLLGPGQIVVEINGDVDLVHESYTKLDAPEAEAPKTKRKATPKKRTSRKKAIA